jgi:glucose 1-dehydrogenase
LAEAPGAGATAPASLLGRRALVTGASSGIGRATAIRLASDGASVVVNYRGSPEDAAAVVEEIEAAGGRAVAAEGDVSQEEEVRALFEQAGEALGGAVDLLVNNAGVEAPYELSGMPLDEWNRVLSVNLTGPFLCSREFVRALPGDHEPAAIVMMSSVHEVIPWPSYSHYCASKGGLKLFSQTIARELAPRGIRVTLVAPGAIATPINDDWLDDPEKRREQEEQIPLGRIARPEEIAAAVSWLGGPEAEYVTGSTLFVDGGLTLYPKLV